jgi:hypothetical protein
MSIRPLTSDEIDFVAGGMHKVPVKKPAIASPNIDVNVATNINASPAIAVNIGKNGLAIAQTFTSQSITQSNA